MGEGEGGGGAGTGEGGGSGGLDAGGSGLGGGDGGGTRGGGGEIGRGGGGGRRQPLSGPQLTQPEKSHVYLLHQLEHEGGGGGSAAGASAVAPLFASAALCGGGGGPGGLAACGAFQPSRMVHARTSSSPHVKKCTSCSVWYPLRTILSIIDGHLVSSR